MVRGCKYTKKMRVISVSINFSSVWVYNDMKNIAYFCEIVTNNNNITKKKKLWISKQ